MQPFRTRTLVKYVDLFPWRAHSCDISQDQYDWPRHVLELTFLSLPPMHTCGPGKLTFVYLLKTALQALQRTYYL